MIKHILLSALALAGWITARASDVYTVTTAHLPDTCGYVRVALPADYAHTGAYPTVYLLNGHGGDHNTWSTITNIDSLATVYQVIIVCPAGLNSWYWDSPVDPTMQMESYVVEDLVPWVDSAFATAATWRQRAITGLSMGGHGALWLAIRHPDIFGNAGSTSGGVDFTPWPKGWNIPDRLGDYATHTNSWEEHTVKWAARELSPGTLNIIIDCGTEDFFLGVNDALHRQLENQGVEHTYVTYPGAHTPAYWRRSILPQMQFFSLHFGN